MNCRNIVTIQIVLDNPPAANCLISVCEDVWDFTNARYGVNAGVSLGIPTILNGWEFKKIEKVETFSDLEFGTNQKYLIKREGNGCSDFDPVLYGDYLTGCQPFVGCVSNPGIGGQPTTSTCYNYKGVSMGNDIESMGWSFEKKPRSTNLYYIKFVGGDGDGCQHRDPNNTDRLMTYLVGCRDILSGGDLIGAVMGTKQMADENPWRIQQYSTGGRFAIYLSKNCNSAEGEDLIPTCKEEGNLNYGGVKLTARDIQNNPAWEFIKFYDE